MAFFVFLSPFAHPRIDLHPTLPKPRAMASTHRSLSEMGVKTVARKFPIQFRSSGPNQGCDCNDCETIVDHASVFKTSDKTGSTRDDEMFMVSFAYAGSASEADFGARIDAWAKTHLEPKEYSVHFEKRSYRGTTNAFSIMIYPNTMDIISILQAATFKDFEDQWAVKHGGVSA